MSILRTESLRLSQSPGGAAYTFPDMCLNEGEVALLVWADHAGRHAWFRALLNPARRAIAGWNITGDLALFDSVGPAGHSGKSIALLLRDVDSQLSSCVQSPGLELSLPLALAGRSVDAQRIAVEFWLNALDLRRVADVPIDRLSTGQKQRLLLASFVALSPDLLVVDGPLEFIDTKSRRQILYLLKQFCVARGTAILVLASRDVTPEVAYFDQRFIVQDLGTTVSSPSVTRTFPTGALSARPPAPCLAVRHLEYVVPASSRRMYRGLSFSVPAGAGVTLVGPNGCGKSTLGHLIGGRIAPLQGSIDVCGQSAQAWFAARRPQIICSFTNPDLALTRASVREEIFSTPAGVLREDTLQEVIRLLELDRALDEKPFDLEWHVRRRLSLAKAIRSALKGVFVDEPAADSSIDQLGRFIEVLKLCMASDLAVVVTTNDEYLARSLPLEVVRIAVPEDPPVVPTDERSSAGRSSLARVFSRRQRSAPAVSDLRWDRNIWSGLVFNWFEHAPEFSTFWALSVYPYLEAKLGELSFRDNFVMVDLACGHGLHTMNVATTLRRNGAIPVTALGVDAESKLIDVARLLFSTGKTVSFEAADLTDLATIRSLAVRLLNQGLPVLYTAFFSLHDLPSIEGIRILLQETKPLGGAFLATLVSPEYVDRASTLGALDIIDRIDGSAFADGTGVVDWRWRGLFPVSADRERQLRIPYFHRELSDYESLLRATWADVEVVGLRSNASPGAIAPPFVSSRRDDVLLLYAH